MSDPARMRDAVDADAAAIAVLLEQLGHPVGVETVRRQLASLALEYESRVLVAESEDRVIAVMSLRHQQLLHRDRPVGRITTLVVEDGSRGQGIGSALVARALTHFTEIGCSSVEVTSNLRRVEAHAFYRALGFEETSAYFRKALPSGTDLANRA